MHNFNMKMIKDASCHICPVYTFTDFLSEKCQNKVSNHIFGQFLKKIDLKLGKIFSNHKIIIYFADLVSIYSDKYREIRRFDTFTENVEQIT